MPGKEDMTQMYILPFLLTQVYGDPGAARKSVTNLARALMCIHYGPIAVDGFQRDIKYLKLLSNAKIEKQHDFVTNDITNSEREAEL
jgi:hypothetical protein